MNLEHIYDKLKASLGKSENFLKIGQLQAASQLSMANLNYSFD